MVESFFNIVPRDTSFMDDYSNAIQLRVVRGIDVDPLVDINVSDLSHGFQHFHNNSRSGIQFKIKVIIDKGDVLGEETIISLLDGYMKDMTPLNIETDAVDIPNGTYLITENPSRSQTFDTKTEWELTFTTYNSLTVYEFKNNNAGVKKALKKAKQHNVKNAKLRKCNYKKLVYSKKKKTVKCVQYMQEVLYNNKFLTKKQVDGWFGKATAEAVKKFQKAYNKKHYTVNTTVKNTVTNKNSNYISDEYKKLAKKTKMNVVTNVTVGGNWMTGTKKSTKVLAENGKVGKATFKALCNS